MKHWKEWTDAERDDVSAVKMVTERDDTGVSYEVRVALRSLAAHAFEEGEDENGAWHKRVDFGATDDTHAGGGAFVRAAREQQRISDEIVTVVWHRG